MTFTSPTFFLFLFLTVLVFHISANVSYRKTVLAIANLVFIATYATAWSQLVPLALFLALGYVLVILVSETRSNFRLASAIVLTLVVYFYLKQFFFFQAFSLPFVYSVVGLSYILFRIIHLLVDLSSGEIECYPGPCAFFRYTCNFLCFVSGPIQTWQEFQRDERALSISPDRDAVLKAFLRVTTGLLKVTVIGAVSHYLFLNVSEHGVLGSEQAGHSIAYDIRYAVAAASYVAYVYYNFLGYMDIVIGVGWLLCLELPENFNEPFAARSFLEFWQRWHITLSRWFKAYVFTPLMLLLVRLFPSASVTTSIGVFCFFVTFLLMGIWHGSTAVFVIYGLFMGFGAAVNKLWQVAANQFFGKKKYGALRAHWAYAELSRGFTFAYFTVAVTGLWVTNLNELCLLTTRLGVVGIASAFGLLTLGFTCLFRPYQMVVNGMRMLLFRIRSNPLDNLLLAGRLLLVVFFMGLMNKSPEFVYKAF